MILKLWTVGKQTWKLWTITFCHPGQRTSECELGEWSQWSSCMKKNKTCGFRKGSQSRSRGPLLQVQGPDASLAFVPSQTCVAQTEKRKCTVTKTPCVRGNQSTKTHHILTLAITSTRSCSHCAVQLCSSSWNQERWTGNKVNVPPKILPTVNMMTDRTITQHPSSCISPSVSVTRQCVDWVWFGWANKRIHNILNSQRVNNKLHLRARWRAAIMNCEAGRGSEQEKSYLFGRPS